MPTYTYIYYEHTGSSLNTRTEARKHKLMDDFLTILHGLIAWRDRQDAAPHERNENLHNVMHYKLSYLAMDLLRMLIRGQYRADYIRQIIGQMRQLELYPLPLLCEFKYLVVRMLTLSPWLVCWWARHPSLSRRIGF